MEHGRGRRIGGPRGASLVLAASSLVACTSAPPGAAPTSSVDAGPSSSTAPVPPAVPRLDDGVRNGDESDVDCGGAVAPPCTATSTCRAGTDCASGVCKDDGAGSTCRAPAPDDGVRNGDESDVDCGGARAPRCVDGKGCASAGDCVHDLCVEARCASATVDGVKNGTETDVDCGGAAAARCHDALGCLVDTDCTSAVCADAGQGLRCQVPTSLDGRKNGVETDVDCGGIGNPRCPTGKSCALHADCVSDGCAYDDRCADRPSCVLENGGASCGLGGAGGRGPAAWESCCATAPAGNGGVAMNKYKVTSGRMRAFMERIHGDVRSFVRQARAAGRIPSSTASAAVLDATAGVSLLPASWDMYLPTSMEGNTNPDELVDTPYDDLEVPGKPGPIAGIYTSAYRYLGDFLHRGQNLYMPGCSVAGFGSHTYWMDANVQAAYLGDVPHAYSQAVYDTKPLNCVPYVIAQAFCIWDGGRLETVDEWVGATGPGTYPWGEGPVMKPQGDETYFAYRFPTVDDAILRNPAYGAPAALVPNELQSIELGAYHYSYEYPNLACGPTFAWCDYAAFMAAPGRTKGRGPWGHADLAGNMMEVTSTLSEVTGDPNDSHAAWTDNGSFEVHYFNKIPTWVDFNAVNRYGKQGLRCVYP